MLAIWDIYLPKNEIKSIYTKLNRKWAKALYLKADIEKTGKTLHKRQRIALILFVLLWFHVNFRFFSISVNKSIGILFGIAMNP